MPLVSMNSKYGTVIRYFLLAAVCMLLLPLFSYGDIKNGGQPDVSDTPIHKKQLKTIIVDNYYPYTFVNQNGDPDGFSIDLIRAVAQEVGLELEIDVDTWELARNALKNGDIDVLPMMAYSKERDQGFDFSVPHTIAYDAFFTRKNGSKIRSLDDLHGKKIIVMKDDQAHDYLRSTGLIGPQQLILVDSLPDALRLLASGKGDAALMPKLVGLIVAKNLKLNNLELSPIVIEDYKRPFSFAVAEGNQSLLERLGQGLSIVKTSNQYRNIYEKWFGALEPPGVSLRIVLKYIGGIILVFIVIGSVLLSWLFSLKRQVALRTRTLNEEITERKQAEEAVRESEQQYRSLVESTEDSIYLVDRNSTYLFMNGQHLSRLGLQPDEFFGRTYGEFHSEDDTQEFAAIVEKVFETGRPIQQEHRSLKDDRCFLRTLSPVRESDGRTRAITVVSKDFTERVRSEEALRESEEKYRQLSDSLPQIVFETDEKGDLTFTNRVAFDIFGYTRADFEKGLNALRMLIPEDRERAIGNMQTVFRGKKLGGTEYTALTKDGRRYPAMVYSAPIISEGKPVGMRGIMADLTEVKRSQKALLESEEKLARSKKMESLGLLAGGVAHDLNNILSGIVSYPELLLMDLPEDSPLRNPIKTIQESGMRAADVVEDLLTIARGVATGKEALNLNALITEYLGSAEYQKLEKTHSFVDFKTELDPDLLNMSGSPTHIKKILMNLVTNASEAIEGSGTVTIYTTNRYLDEPLNGYEDVRMGEYSVLSVLDNGSGISPEDLKRIFEPFYTKKVMGRIGTGLGLAVVWNTVQDHNGYINVKSGENGTIFELYFPTTREQVADEKEQVPLEDYLGHGEKILVVDDEERQREIAGGILTRLGYKAKTVAGGEEAIEYVKEHPVDLIVLDMVMPKGINGRETYEQIIKIRPGQKTIIASGYAKTKEVDAAQELGAGKYIKKPYTLEKVGLAVKEELEK